MFDGLGYWRDDGPREQSGIPSAVKQQQFWSVTASSGLYQLHRVSVYETSRIFDAKIDLVVFFVDYRDVKKNKFFLSCVFLLF